MAKEWLPLLLLVPVAEAALLLVSVRLDRWASGEPKVTLPVPRQSPERSRDAATSSEPISAATNGPATSSAEERGAASSA